MSSGEIFKREELTEKIQEIFGTPEFGLEHINGDMYIFNNSYLVSNVLLTQEIDIYIPSEKVFFSGEYDEKTYLREKIVFEQYVEIYTNKNENFSTMASGSKKAASFDEAFVNLEKFGKKIYLMLEKIAGYYSGEVKYSYQDCRYKGLEKKEYESVSEHGYFVQGSSITNKELSSGNLKKLQQVDDELQKYAESKFQHHQ
ncbi:MAG: hypothetical protein ACTSSN_10805 [Candidatus Heimdallarchaeaceae archaeon]